MFTTIYFKTSLSRDLAIDRRRQVDEAPDDRPSPTHQTGLLSCQQAVIVSLFVDVKRGSWPKRDLCTGRSVDGGWLYTK